MVADTYSCDMCVHILWMIGAYFLDDLNRLCVGLEKLYRPPFWLCRGGGTCGFVGAHSFRSWLLHVAATPSVGACRWSGLVLLPQRRSVLDCRMARLIFVQMKLAMSEYVRLHFFVSSHAMRRSAILVSLEAMPSTE